MYIAHKINPPPGMIFILVFGADFLLNKGGRHVEHGGSGKVSRRDLSVDRRAHRSASALSSSWRKCSFENRPRAMWGYLAFHTVLLVLLGAHTVTALVHVYDTTTVCSVFRRCTYCNTSMC